jgi:hypothetical protein
MKKTFHYRHKAKGTRNADEHILRPWEADAILLAILVAAGKVFQHLSLLTLLDFWLYLPAHLLPLWLQYWNTWDTFLWTKTFSLIPVATVWCTVCRMGLDIDYIRLGSFIILSMNIAEASIKDVCSKRGAPSWSPVNAISGALLILAECPSLRTINMGTTGTNDFLWTLGVPWIMGKYKLDNCKNP